MVRWKLYRKLIAFNRGAIEFLLPKFCGLVVASFFVNNWAILAFIAGLSFATEIVLALLAYHNQFSKGFSQKRANRFTFARTGLALVWAILLIPFFGWLPLWLAILLVLLVWLTLFGAYLALNVIWQIQDMRGDFPADLSAVFEQVRQMQELEPAINQLQTALITAKDKDAIRNLNFYLAWAETFAGHLLVERKAWQPAISRYKNAINYDSSNLAAHAMISVCQARQTEFELALREVERAVSIFNKQFKKNERLDEALWHWHRNEISSEYEQSAGLFQLCALIIGLVQTGNESGATKEILIKELTNEALKIPERSAEELNRLLANKTGKALPALGVLCAGAYHFPADPFELLRSALTLPQLSIQIVEPAA
jgi:tetratricopeptide (TPR) repeat protein